MIDRCDEIGLLPSIHAANRRLLVYAERLAEAGLAPAAALPGLDALLAALFLDRHAERFVVDDRAAPATAGATALLCALRPGAVAVRIPEGDEPWRPVLATFLGELGDSAPLGPPAGPAPRRRVALVHLGGRDRAVDDRSLDEAIGLGGPVLVLGLGRTGSCPGIAAALRGAGGSPHLRFTLFRELAPALSSSGLGLIAPAGDDEAASALERVAAEFVGNFDLLRLVEAHCRLAVAVAQLDDADREAVQPAGHRDGVDGERLVRRYQQVCRDRDRHRDEAERLRGEVEQLLGRVWESDELGRRLRDHLGAVDAERLGLATELGRVRASRAHRVADRAGQLRVVYRREGLGGLVRRLSRKAG